MKLDWRSIWKAMLLGSALAAFGSIFFYWVRLPQLEAVFNFLVGVAVGFLFGWISIRNNGDDRFSSMGVGGAISAVTPVVLAWSTSLAYSVQSDSVARTFQPMGIVIGLLAGSPVGVILGLVGGLIYASKF